MLPLEFENNMASGVSQLPSNNNIQKNTHKPKKTHNMKLLKVGIFILTALTSATMQACRTAWSYSKSEVTKDPYYTDDFLGTLDMTFLIFYATGLYINGWIGDQINLRLFLVVGMCISSLGLALAGFIGVTNMHNKGLLSVAFAIIGIGQSTIWPGTIAIMGNWFESKKRGFLFGAWAINQNFGNIIGQQIGSLLLESYHTNWGAPILVSCGLTVLMCITVFLVLIPDPKILNNNNNPPVYEIPNAKEIIRSPENELEVEANLQQPKKKIIDKVDLQKKFENFEQESQRDHSKIDNNSPMRIKQDEKPKAEAKGIGFLSAWLLPGVIIYVIAFSTVKMNGSGILFWLPLYLKSVVGFTSNISGLLASYEIGQAIGGILIGYISDKLNRRTIVLPIFLLISVSIFFSLQFLTVSDVAKFYILLFFAGICLGGPQTIIASSISADLVSSFSLNFKGENKDLKDDLQAKSTVTGIIDGSGSLAAAANQKLIPLIKSNVFILFMGILSKIPFDYFFIFFFKVCSLIAGLVLIPIAFKELKSKIESGKLKRRLNLDLNLRNEIVNPKVDLIMPDNIQCLNNKY